MVVADHGARVYGKAEIPLESYEIPMMIYAPKHIAPRRVDTLMTQIDIAPTVLGLLGLPYEAPFFGQDVLHTPGSRAIALFSHDHDVAIYRDGRLAVMGMDGGVHDFAYDRAHERFTPVAAIRPSMRSASPISRRPPSCSRPTATNSRGPRQSLQPGRS